MFYEDRISVATPEGVTLEVTLAGVGSRFAAGLVDQLLRLALLAALLILQHVATGGSDVSGGAVAGVVVAVFLVQFGYDVLFETLASGRTPGKRWTGLRVVKAGGGPVGFVASALRNILRIVDSLPGFYLVGILSVLFTRNNQRLGDLAASTLVVRERRQRTTLPPVPPVAAEAAPRPEDGLWDVSGISAEEIATVRRFLDRRSTLAPEARERLAYEMATRLGPKVPGPSRRWDPEEFLEYLVSAKAARG
ncbi:MAG TPA: RDD family protein [Acidimicrobiales bacterium]|nr:RDD family protein [Acidimicrobiales bacterium]